MVNNQRINCYWLELDLDYVTTWIGFLNWSLKSTVKIWVKLNIRNLVKNYPVLQVRSWTLELDLNWDNFKITCLQSIKGPNQKYVQDLFSVGCMMKSNSSPEQNYFNWFIIVSVSKYNCRNYKLKMKIVKSNKIINWQLKNILKTFVECFSEGFR